MMQNTPDQYQLCIADGPDESIELEATSLLDQACTATKFLDCDWWQPSYHAPLLRSIARQSSVILTACNDWMNGRIQKHQIELRFKDGTGCDAAAKELGEQGGIRKSRIELSLGCIARLFGCGNRLLLLLNDNFKGDFWTYGEAYSLDSKWDPINDPLGILTMDNREGLDPSVEIVLDAMQLLYFHEASHLIAAHLSFPILQSAKHVDYDRYRRAAESEADQSAAWLFMEFRKEHFAAIEGIPFAPKSMIRRLTLAGLCHYTTFQIELKPGSAGKRYHLPNIRMRCSFDGARAWWTAALGNERSFVDLVNSTLHLLPTELFFPRLVSGWVELGSESAARDEKVYVEQTENLIEEIRAHTGKNRTFIWRPTDPTRGIRPLD